MPPVGLLADWSAVQDFVFAGNATFTLKSLRTGARFTYKVRVKKEDLLRSRTLNSHGGPSMPANEVVYFVNLLRGPNNTADFAYVGVLRRDPARFFWTSASGKVGRSSPAYKGLLWLLDAMEKGRDGMLGTQVEVWHAGQCGCCGRKLTVPESIASGFGPECGRARAFAERAA